MAVVNCRRDKFDIFIGRPSIYGNPYSHLLGTKAQFKVRTREEAIKKYESYLLNNKNLLSLVKDLLPGKILGCFCYPLPCHGDVLVRIANNASNVSS